MRSLHGSLHSLVCRVRHGRPVTGHVIRVVDGDTIELLHNQRLECMLLRGNDCPEKGTDNLRADCPRPEV